MSMAVSALSLWLCCSHIGKVQEEAHCHPDAPASRPTGCMCLGPCREAPDRPGDGAELFWVVYVEASALL